VAPLFNTERQIMDFVTFDRKSVRRIDSDGHLHVSSSNVTRANVSAYRGDEVPKYRELGLTADRMYRLYRDPAELKAAAQSLAGKPLLLHHKPVNSEDHPEELVVGSVGTDIRYEHPFLKAPLSIWRKDAIDAVTSRDQHELSCGYKFDAHMTPGVSPEGERFDGVMRNIRFNHLSLVKAGRVPGAVVADEAVKAAFDPKILGLNHIRRS
jgi:uncharacterized protein